MNSIQNLRQPSGVSKLLTQHESTLLPYLGVQVTEFDRVSFMLRLVFPGKFDENDRIIGCTDRYSGNGIQSPPSE